MTAGAGMDRLSDGALARIEDAQTFADHALARRMATELLALRARVPLLEAVAEAARAPTWDNRSVRLPPDKAWWDNLDKALAALDAARQNESNKAASGAAYEAGSRGSDEGTAGGSLLGPERADRAPAPRDQRPADSVKESPEAATSSRPAEPQPGALTPEERAREVLSPGCDAIAGERGLMNTREDTRAAIAFHIRAAEAAARAEAKRECDEAIKDANKQEARALAAEAALSDMERDRDSWKGAAERLETQRDAARRERDELLLQRHERGQAPPAGRSGPATCHWCGKLIIAAETHSEGLCVSSAAAPDAGTDEKLRQKRDAAWAIKEARAELGKVLYDFRDAGAGALHVLDALDAYLDARGAEGGR